MKILAIETSCDETAVALLRASGKLSSIKLKVLKSLVSSQIKIHAPFGGVVPNLAKREHLKNLPILLERTLKKIRLDKKEKPVDLIKKMVEHSSKGGDLILDPFCGSGSVCVACNETGRNFIGIEIEEKWCGVARERVN